MGMRAHGPGSRTRTRDSGKTRRRCREAVFTHCQRQPPIASNSIDRQSASPILCTMSAVASRAVLRQSRFAVRRTGIRNASSTTEAAKEKATEVSSKASEGLSRVTSSAGEAASKVSSSTANAAGQAKATSGGILGRVQCELPPSPTLHGNQAQWHAHLSPTTQCIPSMTDALSSIDSPRHLLLKSRP